MEAVTAADLVRDLAKDSSPADVEEALQRANELFSRAGINPMNTKISIPTIKAQITAKIRARECQLRSTRDVKAGGSEVNNKRVAKRKKLQSEIAEFQRALASLAVYETIKV